MANRDKTEETPKEEVLDVAEYLRLAWRHQVADHPYIQSRPKLLKLVEQAADQICDAVDGIRRSRGRQGT